MAIGTLIHFFDDTAVIPNNGNSYNYDQNEGSNGFMSHELKTAILTIKKTDEGRSYHVL